MTSIDFAGNAEESNGFVFLSTSILLLPVCLDADESSHTEETECAHCHSNCWTDKATSCILWLKVTLSHYLKSYWKSCTLKKKIQCSIFCNFC